MIAQLDRVRTWLDTWFDPATSFREDAGKWVADFEADQIAARIERAHAQAEQLETELAILRREYNDANNTKR